ncbi:MAG: DUF3142 domain-containing protein [Verrucomicrobia bacterium]|nr:DUF3142 domain-containing protein [Verrucomicrobiota bacterium]
MRWHTFNARPSGPAASAVIVCLWLVLAASAHAADAIYIWQQKWTPAVASAAWEFREQTSAYLVLTSTVSMAPDNTLSRRDVAVDWPALVRAGRPVEAVLRCGVDTMPALTAERREATARYLAAAWQASRDAAAAKGLVLTGLQIDLDCPTSRLADYRALLQRLATLIAPAPLSITALPDWQRSEHYDTLVAATAYYVLQVHALERPATADDAVRLIPYERVAGWRQRADRAAVPYRIALPTYGYRLVFDAEKHFLGLTAEGPRVAPPPGGSERLLFADPAAIATLVTTLRRPSSAADRGIVWFRLPVVGDDLNWPAAALHAVQAGRQPTVDFRGDLRAEQPGLQDLWIANHGETGSPAQTVRVSLSGRLEHADAMASYRLEATDDQTYVLTGPAPPPGSRTHAAWFRPVADTPITLTSIELLP